MTSTRARTACWAVVVALGFAGGSVAEAQPSEDPTAAPVDTTVDATATSNEARRREAAAHFRMGVSLYEEGDFPAALAEFERANEAAPSAVVLYNIAQTHLALRDYVAANDTLLRYIELGGSRITEARRAEVDAQLATLAMRVGRISVTCNEDGVAVIVDGHTVGRTPITEPLRVSSGRHQIILRASGREPQEQNVTVAGNTEVSVEFAFDPLPPPVVVEETPARTLRTVGWIGMGVGIASGVSAFATFGLAMGARSDYDDATAFRPANEPAASNARDDVRRFSLATDVLTGVAIAGCGAGLALILVDRNRHRDDESAATDTAVVVVPTRGGLNVVGRF